MRYLTLLALTLSSLAVTGCGDAHPNEKPVYKIKGTVTVDGKPESGVQVALHDVAGPDNNQPTYPQGFTDENGNLRISTYADGDGAPAGEYKVTFSWQEYNLISRNYSGPDKLKNRYSDPKKTPVAVKLGEDLPNDLGKVELTSK